MRRSSAFIKKCRTFDSCDQLAVAVRNFGKIMCSKILDNKRLSSTEELIRQQSRKQAKCYAREGMTCGQFESRCSNKRRKQSLERGTGGNAHKSRDSSYFIHRMEWGIERENLKEVGSELEAVN